MSQLKIAVLDMNNNLPNQGMRCILQIIRNFQERDHVDLVYDVFNVRGSDELPDLSYDVYISSGGPGSPLASDEAWEPRFFQLIDDLFDWNERNARKKFVFLICHSFQLVVRHLELGLLSKRRSTSFGIFPMHKEADGLTDPMLKGLPDPFYAVDSRDYQITKPNKSRLRTFGASILCREKIRPHVPLDRAIMAIRFSDEVMGTQFHPEADNQGMLLHMQTEERRKHIVKLFGQRKYDDMVDYLQDPNKIALTESVILPGFLRRALRAQKVTKPQLV
ncbi:GMP synthase-like glutamine amidotransferase [Spirosoma oryzae]|uniref:GMP synthase-like glutamine amidotransferase n=1 Tax=Spirosoma oryzae TaxID=1469603 RepID=A0A2T0TN01_9BACT|nr:GMP synthase [Spirosoma oryzae]PRY47001.1 GMP synthase-like glutamine amidotransferase [Spirosoma oryzae]